MSARPSPMQKTVCSVCDQPWREHLLRSTAYEDGEYAERAVDFTDCIALLKRANQTT